MLEKQELSDGDAVGVDEHGLRGPERRLEGHQA
jgi:hypothetical protein